MLVRCIWEHNGEDTLLWAEDLPGAYTRGKSLGEAMAKMPAEAASFLKWRGVFITEPVTTEVAEDRSCDLNVRDADSDVLFGAEDAPLTREEYETLKALALKSAADFQTLYDAVPDKDASVLPRRKTFYGDVPRTAREMYDHTKSVNDYYFGEIGAETDHDGGIAECRARGFSALEQLPGFLEKPASEGSYGEFWSLRKVLRRFLWHDRTHARAMYRMAIKTFGEGTVPDIFGFEA